MTMLTLDMWTFCSFLIACSIAAAEAGAVADNGIVVFIVSAMVLQTVPKARFMGKGGQRASCASPPRYKRRLGWHPGRGGAARGEDSVVSAACRVVIYEMRHPDA